MKTQSKFTPLVVMKINEYLKTRAVEEIRYLNFRSISKDVEKITTSEFLTFFTDAVIEKFKKNEKISYKQVTKYVLCVDYFLKEAYDYKRIIDPKVIDKIRNFNEFYDDYLVSVVDVERDLELDRYIKDLLAKVEEYYPSEKVEQEELEKQSLDCLSNGRSVKEYIDEILKLEKQIEVLNKDLNNQKALCKALEKKNNSLDSQYEKKCQFLNEANKELNNKQVIINKLNDSIEELKSELQRMERVNLNLFSVKQRYEELLLVVEELKKQIEAKDKLIEKYNKEKAEAKIMKQRLEEAKCKEDAIKDFILQRLFEGAYSIDEIVCLLFEKGYVCQTQEIFNYINELKSRFNIVKTNFNGLVPKYKIAKPEILKNGRFNIEVPKNQNCYDILLISDLHLTSFSDEVKNDLKLIGDYCKRKSISLVLNLGDFFDFKSFSQSAVIRNFTGCENVVKRAISTYPYVNGVYNAVMGGNHDRYAFDCGIDPIQNLADAREDFINLGYDHAKIVFNNVSTIVLHHPSKSFPEPVGEESFDTTRIMKYVNYYYTEYRENRNITYMDVLGHFHKGCIDSTNSLCILPSYFGDRQLDGAYHMKVYFDENRAIKNLVFMPLIKGVKAQKRVLNPVMEIGYEKKLIK